MNLFKNTQKYILDNGKFAKNLPVAITNLKRAD